MSNVPASICAHASPALAGGQSARSTAICAGRPWQESDEGTGVGPQEMRPLWRESNGGVRMRRALPAHGQDPASSCRRSLPLSRHLRGRFTRKPARWPERATRPLRSDASPPYPPFGEVRVHLYRARRLVCPRFGTSIRVSPLGSCVITTAFSASAIEASAKNPGRPVSSAVGGARHEH